ncbi:MAG: hypothetical protein QM768_21720 [Agriterribacter sp.]
MSIDKKRQFMDVVFVLFKDDNNYENVAYQMERCYDLMCIEVKKFRNLSVKTMFEICSVAVLISNSSALRAIKTIRLKPSPESDIEKKYSLEYGFKPGEIIPLKQIQ